MIDDICNHLYVGYLGMQLDENDKPYCYLVNCLDCKTTLVYNSDSQKMIEGNTEYNSDLIQYGMLKVEVKKDG